MKLGFESNSTPTEKLFLMRKRRTPILMIAMFAQRQDERLKNTHIQFGQISRGQTRERTSYRAEERERSKSTSTYLHSVKLYVLEQSIKRYNLRLCLHTMKKKE